MDKVKVCIIDESIEVDTLNELVSDIPPINIIPYNQCQNASEISHGTICLALLLEALQSHNLMDKVSITHYSVTENGAPRTYKAFMGALQYCIQNRMDIVSMSIGVMNRICAGEINQVLNVLRDTLIVASASNNCKLSYPASMPSVLGVKNSPLQFGQGYTVVDDPPDGVELIANLPKSSVMKKIQQRYKYISADSNSFLAPRVCAEIINKSLINEIKATKRLAMQWLKSDVRSARKSYNFFSNETVEDDTIPIIHLEYKNETAEQVLSRAKKIKSKFDCLQYPCALISETIDMNDFVQGFYHLDTTHGTDCIDYYRYVVSDSLILVLSRRKTTLNYPFDYVFPNWVNWDISNICYHILQQFNEEEHNEKGR